MVSSKKSTIILLFLFLIITLVGIFRIHIYSNEKLKKINQINEQKRKTIKEIADKVKDYDKFLATLKDIEERWKQRERVLQRDEQSGKTLLFLNEIASEENSAVKFDFTFIEKKLEEGYGYSKYNITGDGFYSNVYRFINKIEYDRNLYKIKSFNVRGVEEISEKSQKSITKVSFSFILEAYFNPDENDFASVIEPSVNYKKQEINPFNPLLKKNIPPNKRGLIEVEDAKLEAISLGKILIRDKKGRFKSLEVGDEVYLGYLTDIRSERNEAEFTLNKGGLIKKVVLKVFTRK